ncbi:hypothetical protein HY837_02785 [archaeon]|nr:hypothetical protein [archaeon]
MQQQKKRHNPEITPEDRALSAFDRNNDAVLEDKVKIEKGDTAFRKEFAQLISEYFGDDLYYTWRTGYGNSYNLFSKTYQDLQDFENHSIISLKKMTKKGGWFREAKFEDYIRIELTITRQTEDGKTTARLLPIFQNGQYNPIKVRAYTPQALKQAKEFAKAYKELTGQEVTLIQECAEEELKEQSSTKNSLDQITADIVAKTIKNERKRFSRNLFRGLLYGSVTTTNLLGAANAADKGDTNNTLIAGGMALLMEIVAWSWYKTEVSAYEKSLNKSYRK